jgi:hypothetical protein
MTQDPVPSWTALVRDVSHTGLCLILQRQLDQGASLLVELWQAGQTVLPSTSAKVVHSQLHTSGDWLSGCEFAKPLGDDEFEALCGSSGDERPDPIFGPEE